jgi:hypothetical protein
MDARRLSRVLVHLEGDLAADGSTLLTEEPFSD